MKLHRVAKLGGGSLSPSPRRAWIEISLDGYIRHCCRSPSPRRAWIEIPPAGLEFIEYFVSPSPRRAWIEIAVMFITLRLIKSPSPRRAWIEIRC